MESPIKVDAMIDQSANPVTPRRPLQIPCEKEKALNGMRETSLKTVSFYFSTERPSNTLEDPNDSLNPKPTEDNAVPNRNGFKEEMDQRTVPSATVTDENRPTECDSGQLKKFLLDQRAFLEEHVDPDSGLLNSLRSMRILNRQQIAEVNAKETFYQRNAAILNFIFKIEKEGNFADALKDSNQKHLANFIENNGGKHGYALCLLRPEYFNL